MQNGCGSPRYPMITHLWKKTASRRRQEIEFRDNYKRYSRPQKLINKILLCSTAAFELLQ